jgi:hypothetical protein
LPVGSNWRAQLQLRRDVAIIDNVAITYDVGP